MVWLPCGEINGYSEWRGKTGYLSERRLVVPLIGCTHTLRARERYNTAQRAHRIGFSSINMGFSMLFAQLYLSLYPVFPPLSSFQVSYSVSTVKLFFAASFGDRNKEVTRDISRYVHCVPERFGVRLSLRARVRGNFPPVSERDSFKNRIPQVALHSFSTYPL